MRLFQRVHDVLTLGVLLLRHHVFHHTTDCQRQWGAGEVFLRCERCGLRSQGVQTGPPRIANRLPRHAAKLRLA